MLTCPRARGAQYSRLRTLRVMNMPGGDVEVAACTGVAILTLQRRLSAINGCLSLVNSCVGHHSLNIVGVKEFRELGGIERTGSSSSEA